MKLRMLSLMLLLVLLLTACQSSNSASSGLSSRMKKEIEAAFTEEGMAPDFGIPYAWDGEHATFKYYGIFEEWAIVEQRYGTTTAVITRVKIGDHDFGKVYGGNTTRLYAFKDGELLTLEEAYEGGLISDASIAEIAKLYRGIK